jgi:hypothetical protein
MPQPSAFYSESTRFLLILFISYFTSKNPQNQMIFGKESRRFHVLPGAGGKPRQFNIYPCNRFSDSTTCSGF